MTRKGTMDHDWVPCASDAQPGSYAWDTADDWICARCGSIRHYWETNIPCGTRYYTSYRNAAGKRSEYEPPCVAKETK